MRQAERHLAATQMVSIPLSRMEQPSMVLSHSIYRMTGTLWQTLKLQVVAMLICMNHMDSMLSGQGIHAYRWTIVRHCLQISRTCSCARSLLAQNLLAVPADADVEDVHAVDGTMWDQPALAEEQVCQAASCL